MDVDEIIQQKVLPEYRDIAGYLRSLMREAAPEAHEEISYGIPAWRIRKIIAVLSPTKKNITFSFSRGAEFEDKYGLLGGVGKVSRYVKIGSLADSPTEALRYYIAQAVELEKNQVIRPLSGAFTGPIL